MTDEQEFWCEENDEEVEEFLGYDVWIVDHDALDMSWDEFKKASRDGGVIRVRYGMMKYVQRVKAFR